MDWAGEILSNGDTNERPPDESPTLYLADSCAAGHATRPDERYAEQRRVEILRVDGDWMELGLR